MNYRPVRSSILSIRELEHDATHSMDEKASISQRNMIWSRG